MVEFAFAVEIHDAHRYCATIGRAKLEKFYKRRFIAEPVDDAATMTSLNSRNKFTP